MYHLNVTNNFPFDGTAASADACMVGFQVAADVQVQPAGGNQLVNNMQPFQVVNYCIAVNGVYPSRS